MRAAVIAIKNGQAAITDEAGGMHYIDDKGYCIGQIIDWQEPAGRGIFPLTGKSAGLYSIKTVRTLAGIAAGLILVAGAGGITATAATTSTVTIGSDRILEYRVNAFDRVVGFDAGDALDADSAENIASRIKWMKLDEAIDVSLDSIEDNYFAPGDDGNPPDVKVKSRFKGKEDKLENITLTELENRGLPANVGAPSTDGTQKENATPQENGRDNENEIPPSPADGFRDQSGTPEPAGSSDGSGATGPAGSSGGSGATAPAEPSGGSTGSESTLPPPPEGSQNGSNPAASQQGMSGTSGGSGATGPAEPSGGSGTSRPAGTAVDGAGSESAPPPPPEDSQNGSNPAASQQGISGTSGGSGTPEPAGSSDGSGSSGSGEAPSGEGGGNPPASPPGDRPAPFI